MTVKELIINFLSQRDEYVLSGVIGEYIVSAGYKRNSSDSALARMVAKGQALRSGSNHTTSYKLNPDYVEIKTKPVEREKPKSINVIAEECRRNSSIYYVDGLLRTVRRGELWSNAATASSH